MPNERDIKKKVNRGLAWVGLASSTVGLLDIVAIIIILGLWVGPEAYAPAVLAITLFPVLDLATDMGLSAAVIQRDDHTEAKISTVFWLNVIMSVLLFAAVAFLIAPGLSAFHDKPLVGQMLTLYGVKLLWQNVYSIPSALMRRELRFKELSGIRIVANLAEFGVKVGTAPFYGVWCFVFGPLARVLVTGIGVQLLHPWRPRLILRVREAIDWAVFGFKTSASQILFHLYTNVDYQVVGYYFSDAALGLYRVAYEIVLEPCRVIGEVIVQIAFPAFSRIKHRAELLVDQLIQFTRMNLVIMIGFLGVVFLSAEELLLTFWGAKWAPATTALRILCAVGVLRALSFVVPPLLDGIGRPSLTLVYTTVAAVILPSCFVVFALFLGPELEQGFLSVAIAWAVGYPIAFAVLIAIALALLGLPLREYLRRTIGIPACAVVAMSLAAGAKWLVAGGPPWLRLLVASAVMVGVFFALLAYTQGISPRSVARAVKGEQPQVPPPPTPPAGEHDLNI
jgi:O-antigen/teichoic acid export membrane protein